MGRLRFELRTSRLKAGCSTAELATPKKCHLARMENYHATYLEMKLAVISHTKPTPQGPHQLQKPSLLKFGMVSFSSFPIVSGSSLFTKFKRTKQVLNNVTNRTKPSKSPNSQNEEN